MASVVLSVVGGAIAGPIGAAVGSVVGAVVDSLLVSALTPTQKAEGQRLSDLKITTSTEGIAIPRVYGRARMGGNIIWATDFREEKHTSDSGGGKGGGGVETTEYLYFASFAIALCEGEIAGIGRVWADGKEFKVKGAVYRVHKGAETQQPDSLIETKMGTGNAPAYRGVAYVVFDDLPLEKFGNRIPQLTFEVFRHVDDPDSAEKVARAVNLIPGAGEFVYATEKILNTTASDTRAENVNSSDSQPDILVSLDQLETNAPNLESVSLVVAWFGSDLRCGQCLIKPGVETLTKSTTPKSWGVNGVARANAHLVSEVSGAPAFGGTPADFSVDQAIAELKARGYRVTFYPFLLMDVAEGNTLPDPYSDNAATLGQPKYPWRGRITCSPAAGYAGTVDKTAPAATQVDAFFGNAQSSDFSVNGTTVSWTGGSDWGYRRMVLHYAKLCATINAADPGAVDTFLIGSELRGLTQIRSSASAYPAVAKLKTLATDVKSILGPGVKVGYAADWSEYFGHQPTDGSGDVYFNLDPVWADANIDFVGIDNYMPLADWREGFSHADALAGRKSIYDRSYLESNIEGGEGFNWYYASQANRDAQVRTPITDGAYGKPWVYRYKDIRAWWSNSHYDRPGGVESGTPTAWVAKSKPIRFTEAGCPAVDKGANQPNVFVDPKSSESAYPYYSLGNRDDAIQRRFIEALHHYWNSNNPSGGTYGGPMLDMGELAVWCWDARPYPAFPGRSDVWGDAENWRFGHWLNGRLGDSGLAALVKELCKRGGLADTDIDVSQLAASVPGYHIEAIASARSSIEPLARFYGFDAVESDGVIRFVPRGTAPVATVTPDNLVAAKREEEDIEFIRAQETELPLALKWRFTRPDRKYEGMTVEARRITVDTARVVSESFPIVAAGAEADMRCRRALMEAWVQRETAKFQLTPSRLALDPTDVVLIEHDGRQLEFRLASIADQDARIVDALRTDAVIYGARPGPERDVTLPPPTVYGPPIVAMMDLPILDEDVPAYRPYIGLYAAPWYGQAAVWKSPTLDGFSLLDTIGRPACMGTLAFAFYGGPTSRFDLGNAIYVDMLSGMLTSITDLELFAGSNTLAVESSAGAWEIVQFANAELVATNRYKLTRLLRGQRGTEGAVGNPAPAGARVVMLDSDIAALSIASTDVGIAYNWMIGPASEGLTDISYAQVAFTPRGIGLRPYSVAHVSQPWKFARTPGDLTISWKRRTRAPIGDSWDAIEVPLFEDIESYEVDILDGSTVKRTLATNTTGVLYAGAQQTADWGAPLGPGNSLQVRLYQVSQQFGRGAPKFVTLYF
jgi:hypothetical protein